MSSKKMPVVEIIKLLRQRVITVVVILCITLSSSYLYNKHLKKIFYNYSLEFISLSELEAFEIGITSKGINSSIKSLVLDYLNDFNADNTNVVLEESYFIISFQSMQLINTKLFFEKLSEAVNKNINNFLSNKYSLLQAKERIIVSDIKKIINDKRLDMDAELQTLKNERENMLRVFGKTIKNPVVNNDLLGSTEYELIQNYYLLEKKIIKLMQRVNLANSEYVIRNEPSYISKTEELNILRQQIINLKYQIQAIENPNFKSITKIGDWKVKSNNLSLVEIIIAGILFGILLNTLYLFFTSKYFRNMKI
jgi:hypothetical protein